MTARQQQAQLGLRRDAAVHASVAQPDHTTVVRQERMTLAHQRLEPPTDVSQVQLKHE